MIIICNGNVSDAFNGSDFVRVRVMCECAAGLAFDRTTTIGSNETIFSN